jgi:hypothetical protein
MAPTDREFERLMRAVETLEGKVDKMQATLDQQAGMFMVAKWLGFGSLASVAAMGAYLFDVLRSQN